MRLKRRRNLIDVLIGRNVFTTTTTTTIQSMPRPGLVLPSELSRITDQLHRFSAALSSSGINLEKLRNDTPPHRDCGPDNTYCNKGHILDYVGWVTTSDSNHIIAKNPDTIGPTYAVINYWQILHHRHQPGPQTDNISIIIIIIRRILACHKLI